MAEVHVYTDAVGFETIIYFLGVRNRAPPGVVEGGGGTSLICKNKVTKVNNIFWCEGDVGCFHGFVQASDLNLEPESFPQMVEIDGLLLSRDSAIVQAGEVQAMNYLDPYGRVVEIWND